MTSTITQLYGGLSDKDKPAQLVQETVKFFQDDLFFRLAFEKEMRVGRLITMVRGKPVPRVLLCHHFRNLSVESSPIKTVVLEENFFDVRDDLDEERKAAYLSGAIVVVNNTEAGLNSTGYIRLYNRCTNTVFVVWDWDNHHWMSVSALLASHGDMYVPTHRENLYALSRYNSVITEPIPALSVQWSKPFLRQCMQQILSQSRCDEPLGLHVMYGAFVYRNRVLSTLSQKIPTIGFSTQQFHSRTDADRLEEWCGYKSHWIVPVLNDIPTRIFDALITGGIPIVPESLRFFEPIRTIGREHILFYGPGDIVTPEAIATKAKALFDQGGKQGIMARHRYALEHLHGEKSIEQILTCVMEKFEILR